MIKTHFIIPSVALAFLFANSLQAMEGTSEVAPGSAHPSAKSKICSPEMSEQKNKVLALKNEIDTIKSKYLKLVLRKVNDLAKESLPPKVSKHAKNLLIKKEELTSEIKKLLEIESKENKDKIINYYENKDFEEIKYIAFEEDAEKAEEYFEYLRLHHGV